MRYERGTYGGLKKAFPVEKEIQRENLWAWLAFYIANSLDV